MHDCGVTTHLAYAAFHCSSRRAFAVSMSPCDTNREPTAPVEIEGIESSIARSENGYNIGSNKMK